MLTEQILKENASLQGLTADQLSAIVILSQNDENSVLAKKTKEFNEKYEDTIAKATGIAKLGNEESQSFLERAVGEVKKKAQTSTALLKQIEDLTNANKDLTTKLENNSGDEALKTQLGNVRAELEQTKKHYNDAQVSLATAKTEHTQALHNLKVEAILTEAEKNFTFKKDIPERVMSDVLANVKKNILANKTEFAEIGGKQVLIFRDENGATLNNPSNQLNPFTASELYERDLNLYGVLDAGRKQPGGGTVPDNKKQGGSSTIDLSGVRTQVEANNEISKHLLEKGLVRGSEKYQEALSTAWTENEVSSLPEK